MEIENCSRMKDGLCTLSHLICGILFVCVFHRFSTSFLSMGSVPKLPNLFSGLGKKKFSKKKIRIFIDGCFDLMHYGHANALRQAKALGDELVVGVISDEEITLYKGPPVLSIKQRLTLVSGLKWVDEVIPNIPYALSKDFMNTLFKEYNIDYIVHGDDPCILADGTDAYAPAKIAGRYKQIKRTEGVSSTDIVGRILSTKVSMASSSTEPDNCMNTETKNSYSSGGQMSHFLPTSRRIVQFSNGKSPGPTSQVVYIDGAFDLFHAGHMEILKNAKQLGDFLLVGIYSDQTISELRGNNFPLMNLLERSLSVLACRFVDDVIIGAPFEVTKDLITTFNISLVVRGTVAENNSLWNDSSDPYSVPKTMGIFRLLESPEVITTSSIVQRILANHGVYQERYSRKQVTETKYYVEKQHVAAD